MRKLTFLATVFCLFLSGRVFGQSVPFSDGQAVVNTNVGDHNKVNLTLKTSVMGRGYSYQSALLWGGDDQGPKRFISAALLRYDGQQILLPLSSFGDLGDPNSVEVSRTNVGFNIIIVGSDAAGSYRAVLVFRTIDGNMLLQSRMVRSGEFPDQGWEKTVYSYVTQTN